MMSEVNQLDLIEPLSVSRGTQMPHSHVFDSGNPLAQRNTKRALILTSIMMVAEIIGGYAFNSMALLADGWHMSTHALALGVALLAYMFARRFARDPRFAFGTWKIEILGGYTSALLLLVVAASMFFQSIERLFSPVVIHYNEAIAICVVGLTVNVVCAWLLNGSEHHHHHGHHHHGHNDHEHGQDLNLRSAYIHVVTDAATSVLAIIALICGKFWGAAWLDPTMGIVGGVLVTVWAVSLMRATGRVLLDAQMDDPVVQEIRDVMQTMPQLVLNDLHTWRVGNDKYACIVSLTSHDNSVTPDWVRAKLQVHEELVHITVEINPAKI